MGGYDSTLPSHTSVEVAKVILKRFKIPRKDRFSISMPCIIEFICIDIIDGEPYLFGWIDPDSPEVSTYFYRCTDKNSIDYDFWTKLRYVDSYSLPAYSLPEGPMPIYKSEYSYKIPAPVNVYHLFEIVLTK